MSVIIDYFVIIIITIFIIIISNNHIINIESKMAKTPAVGKKAAKTPKKVCIIIIMSIIYWNIS
jgi:hypothetical protein